MLDEIRNGIDCGLTFESKSSTFTNWSPNNLRALLVGANKAVLFFHTSKSNSKFKSKVVCVNYPAFDGRDIAEFSEKLLLTVLTKNRVCSCIEEVIFCPLGFNSQVLYQSMNLTPLGTSEKAIETRFPRLQNVASLNNSVSVDSVMQYLRSGTHVVVKNSDLLLSLLSSEFGCKCVYNRTSKASPYWSNAPLRGNFYAYDDAVLRPYFDNLMHCKCEERSKLRVKEAADSITRDKVSKVLKSRLVQCNYNLYSELDKTYESGTMQDKLIFLHVLNVKHIKSAFVKVMQGVLDTVPLYSDILQVLTPYTKGTVPKRVLDDLGVSSDDIESTRVKYIYLDRKYNFASVMKSHGVHVAKTVDDSIDALYKCMSLVFNLGIALAYSSIITYVRHFIDSGCYASGKLRIQKVISGEVQSACVTNGIVHLCNVILGCDDSGDILHSCNISSVSSDKLNVNDSVKAALSILQEIKSD